MGLTVSRTKQNDAQSETGHEYDGMTYFETGTGEVAS